MAKAARRRVSEKSKIDSFWIVDATGNVGLYITATFPFSNDKTSLNLKEINYIKKNNNLNKGEIFLLCPKKEDQLFYKVCQDLLNLLEINTSTYNLEIVIENRLQKWQELFKNSNFNNISFEVQMGLFSELYFLNNVLAKKTGIEAAILSWVGPDAGLQDFALSKSAIEIKSYITSNGPEIKISTASQLYTEKENLYLCSYGLTKSSIGNNILDLINELKINYTFDAKSRFLFEGKLLDYGFLLDMKNDQLTSFLVDSCRVYSVDSEFPKIPANMPPAIKKVSYSIDLNQCISHEINIDKLNLY